MTRQPTLLFGDDGSPGADAAWLWINSQPWPGWRVEIVTASVPEFLAHIPAERSETHVWEPPNPRIAFTEAHFGDVAHLAVEKDPRLALSRAVDLLVIGPRGPGLEKSLHLGSTAEWLLLHPPAPMVIARHGSRVRTIVLAHDGSAHADLVTDVLCRLPWIESTAVTVVCVDDRRVDVARAVDGATAKLEAAGAVVSAVIDTGKPTAKLFDHLELARPDLVAMGTRGLTGLKRLRVGSTAGAIARAATCSVLLACADIGDASD